MEVAVGCMKMAVTIKGGREAEALEEEADDAGINDDEFASGGRGRPTTPKTTAEAANIDDDTKAMNIGRCHPPQEDKGRRGSRRPHEDGPDHQGRT